MTDVAERTPWYRIDGADVVFAVLALVIFHGSRQGMLDDPGLGWHLRNVDAMIQQGGWLYQDPFAGPRHGQPYYTNQWLGDLPLWLGERWAGLEGIAVVTALVLALTFRCLYRMMMRDGAPWPVAVIWIALAALATSPSWVARPNIFTMLFVPLTARACVLLHEGRLSFGKSLWLWPLFAAWANIHGGFIAGLVMLVVTLVIEAALVVLDTTAEGRQRARRRLPHLALLTAGAAAATLVNPYGPRLYPWLFQLLGEPFFMDLHQEWRSPDFHGKGAFRFEILLLLFPFLVGASRRRPTLVELGLAILWLHFALTGYRYVALWVLVATPVMARCSLELPWLQALGERLRARPEESALLRPRTGQAPWAWSVLLAAVLLGGAKLLEGRFSHHDPTYIPTAGLDRVVALHREDPEGAVFHAYDWGGYLTWKGWPELRTWIDDRNEVQGKEHIEEYFAILQARPGWQEKLERADVDLVALFPHAPLAGRLAESPGWKERYRDGYVVIFERP